MNFSYHNSSLDFQQMITYQAAQNDYQVILGFGESVTRLTPDTLDTCNIFRSAVCENSHLKVTRQLALSSKDPSHMRIRLAAKNISSEDIFIKDLIPVFIEDMSQIRMGNTKPENWKFFRQGRHKNDLPSVCTLGTFDDNFYDAAGSLSETGGQEAHGAQVKRLTSDQLSILYGGEKNHILFGFTTSRHQFTECTVTYESPEKPQSLMVKASANIRVEPGITIYSEWLRIDLSEDLEEKIRRFAFHKAMGQGIRKSKATPAPSVFCTWYYYGLTVTYEDVKECLTELKKKELPFDVFQIDEGWEITLGEWEPNSKFPKPMAEIAREIKKFGYRPGIWTSPFIAHASASVWKEHPEWILKKPDGSPCLFPMNDTVYQVFDITRPETWDYFKALYEKLTVSWGYTYHKLDFTRAAILFEDACFYDDTITLVEAYIMAVSAIRQGMGEDSYFLMCGGLYDPLIGLVDAQRSGSDVLSMWQSALPGGGKTAPFTIKQSLLRYFMNTWWHNDPDALMIRRQTEPFRNLPLTYGLLNDEEVKTSVLNQYMGGGLVCSTEPLKTIEDDRLYQLVHIMPAVNVQVTPKDLFSGTRYPSLVDVFVVEKNYHTFVQINWSDDLEIPARLVLDKQLLGSYGDNHGSYLICEFFSGSYRIAQKDETVTLGAIKPHGSALLKVTSYDKDSPFIVGSTGHFSMGGEVKVLMIQDNVLHFETDYPFQVPVTYKILLPVLYRMPDGNQIAEITIPDKSHTSAAIPLIHI